MTPSHVTVLIFSRRPDSAGSLLEVDKNEDGKKKRRNQGLEAGLGGQSAAGSGVEVSDLDGGRDAVYCA